MTKHAMPTGKTEAPTKMTRAASFAVIRRVSKYLFAHKGLVLLCFCLMLLSNVLSLAAPKLSQKAIDAIEPGVGLVDLKAVAFFCAMMLFLYALSAALSYLLAVLMVRLSQKIVYTMRKEIFNHLTELPVGYFDTHATGEIISRISYDVDTVNTSLSHDLLQVGASVVTVVGSLIMMASISPVLLSIFAVTVPISIFYTRLRSTRVRPLFRKRSKKLGELNGFAEEMLSGQKTIRAYSRESVILKRFDEKNNEAVSAYYDSEYYSAMIGPTINLINNLSLSLVTMLGGIFYLFFILNETGATSILPIFTVTLGGMSAFVQYSRKFTGPVNEFAKIIHDLQSAAAAAEKVFAVIDEAPETPDAPDAVA